MLKCNTKLLVMIRKKFRTQLAFSKEVGIHQTEISQVINGWFNLSNDRKKKYAKTLDCKVDDIF